MRAFRRDFIGVRHDDEELESNFGYRDDIAALLSSYLPPVISGRQSPMTSFIEYLPPATASHQPPRSINDTAFASLLPHQ